MDLNVVKIDGSNAGGLEVPSDIFGLEPRVDLLHLVVRYQLAKKRAGTHKVKSRGEVSASTRKVGPQKGSGGARHGNRKASQFRGGGVAFGPSVRSHAISVPKKVRKLALRHALSARNGENKLLVLDSTDFSDIKTKNAKIFLDSVDVKKCLLVVDKSSEECDKLCRSFANLPGVEVLPVIGLNVYSIIKHEVVVLSKKSVDLIVENYS